MSLSMKGRICSKCNKQKELTEFYTKGDRIDSRCKECAKKLRVKRYKKRKKEKARRKGARRVMTINKVTFIERFETNPLRRKRLCQCVNKILEDHFLRSLNKSYAKDKIDAA
ncbi:MAG: hypothetical protein R3B45_16430 [Bdellovibrionota bacterium]